MSNINIFNPKMFGTSLQQVLHLRRFVTVGLWILISYQLRNVLLTSLIWIMVLIFLYCRACWVISWHWCTMLYCRVYKKPHTTDLSIGIIIFVILLYYKHCMHTHIHTCTCMNSHICILYRIGVRVSGTDLGTEALCHRECTCWKFTQYLLLTT